MGLKTFKSNGDGFSLANTVRLRSLRQALEPSLKGAVAGLFLFLLMLYCSPLRAQEMDPFTRAVVEYELTLPKLDAYSNALDDLVIWNKTHPEEAKDLNQRRPQSQSVVAAGERLEAVSGIKEILDRHQLKGRDFVLIPMVLLSSRLLLMAEMQNRPIPPDRFNAQNVALLRDNLEQIEPQLNKIYAQLAGLREQP